MIRKAYILLLLISTSCTPEDGMGKTLAVDSELSKDTLAYVTPYSIENKRNFLTDYEPIDKDGNIHVVVEIPSGTIQKWEVEKETGELNWQFKNNKPRTIQYLGYPGNYGMIPRTLQPKNVGGDGDPLDVIILGRPISRGSVVKAKLIGVLKLLDGGERDDKLIAVAKDTPFHKLQSIDELENEFIGSTIILETFFKNYKGPGEMESLGYYNKKEAFKVLESGIQSFEEEYN